jgi:hypothetical protein
VRGLLSRRMCYVDESHGLLYPPFRLWRYAISFVSRSHVQDKGRDLDLIPRPVGRCRPSPSLIHHWKRPSRRDRKLGHDSASVYPSRYRVCVPSFSLSASLSVRLSVCPSACPPVRLPVRRRSLPVCLEYLNAAERTACLVRDRGVPSHAHSW